MALNWSAALGGLGSQISLLPELKRKEAEDALNEKYKNAQIANLLADNERQKIATQSMADERAQKQAQLEEQNQRIAIERPQIGEAIKNLGLDFQRISGMDPETLAIKQHGPATGGEMSRIPQKSPMATKSEGIEPAKFIAGDNMIKLPPLTMFDKPRDINPLLANKQYRELGLQSGISTSELPEAKQAASYLEKLAQAEDNKREENQKYAHLAGLEKIKANAENISSDAMLDVSNDAKLVVDGKKNYANATTKYGARGTKGIAYKQALDEEIMKLEPNFDFALNDMQYKNGNDPVLKKQVIYSNSLLDRMESATKALNAYNKGDIKAFNNLAKNIGIKMGDPKAVVAKVNQLLVGDEAQRLLGSGQGSDAALEEAKTLADPDLSPQQTEEVMKTVVEFVQARRNEILSSMGPFGRMYSKDYTKKETDATGAKPIKSKSGNTYTF